MKKTPFYQQHIDAGAQMVDFAGWMMPLHYGSQLEEHKQVRRDAGMFDVSHMHGVEVLGLGASSFLQTLLANDIAKLKAAGKALYSCMLNEAGGVVDDLIVYRISDTHFRLILNAATRDKATHWLQHQANHFDVTLKPLSDMAILAVQGPNAIAKTCQALPDLAKQLTSLKPFNSIIEPQTGQMFARTGYTGEDGLEILLPCSSAADLWTRLVNAGVAPIGLGARDTLRLEAGMNLYGQDMDEQSSPLISNLAWTVDWRDEKRVFVGRAALEAQRAAGVQQQLLGLTLTERGVLRRGQAVMDAQGRKVGDITSGGFAPTLGHAIAFARLPVKLLPPYYVTLRGKTCAVQVTSLPFVRQGHPVFELITDTAEGTQA